MKILLSGSSGFIGKELQAFFKKDGHSVTCLVRDPSLKGIYWDPEKKQIDIGQLEGFDLVICLNGANVAKRWSFSYKKKLINSRVMPAEFLCESLSKVNQKPQVYFQASAVGYYGDRKELADESADQGDLYLSKVCYLWENAASSLDPKIRKVFMRFGLVLGKNGGALNRMIPIFKAYLGAVMGREDTRISFISTEDIYKAICHIFQSKEINGAVNFTTPKPETAKHFYKAVGAYLNRPCFFTIPPIAIKILFGQMGKELFLSNSNVIPKKLLDSNYQFCNGSVEDALQEIKDRT